MDQTSDSQDATSTFSVVGFYGREGAHRNGPWTQQRLTHVLDGFRHMNLNPPPREFSTGLLGPPATWKVFPRQAQAIEFAQTQGQGLMVFAFEGEAVGDTGQRRFVVTHPLQMWQRQTERQPDHRCSYEVIQEGAVCKLYFDLEFLHVQNPQSNGTLMITNFIAVVCYFLLQEFNVRCSRADVIDLCSSSKTKFSRHLIFNVPNVAFIDNINVGHFVAMMCDKIRAFDEGKAQIDIPGIEENDIASLFVFDSKGNRLLFCDEGVYTKNRNFRLYLSTKHGKQTPLIVSSQNQYHPSSHPGEDKEKCIFLDSLVTLVDEKCEILTYEEVSPRVKRRRGVNGNFASPNHELEGRGHSPYPETDNFIERIVSPGSVRRWYYFSHGAVIVYEIAHNRFCHNIGRPHHSNGIMYVVDLRNATYYQKCHDPDCHGFRSDPKPLPKDVAFWHSLTEEDCWDTSATGEDVFSKGKDVQLTGEVDEQLTDKKDDQLTCKKDGQLTSEKAEGPTSEKDEQPTSENSAQPTSKNDEQSASENDEQPASKIDVSDSSEDWLTRKAEILSGVTDQELVNATKAIEKWDRLDCSFSSSCSTLGSQSSSQNSSQRTTSSNPWDRLSQLSSLSSYDQMSGSQSSQSSSQNSSQWTTSSNPWDRLSQLSSLSSYDQMSGSQSSQSSSHDSSQRTSSSNPWDRLSQISSSSSIHDQRLRSQRLEEVYECLEMPMDGGEAFIWRT